MNTASICTIGDEILIGQIVDTNSSHIARELESIGVKVRYMTSIGDVRENILSELGRCLDETDIVIVTGGLGPTKDDITKDALLQLSGSSGYRESKQQMAHVERILTARGIPMLDTNRAQALVPDKCTVLENKLGTAPGMAFHGLGRKGTSALYSLPGVPFEAEGLLPSVIDDIRAHFSLEKITHRTIVTFGIPESTLAKRIEAWEDALPSNIKLAYLPNPTIGVRLRLSQNGGDADFEPYVQQLRSLIGDAIYGEGDDTLQKVIGDKLRAAGKTLSLAESCTGGHLSQLITSVSGCSDYYKGSVTSYANEVKTGVLGVPSEIIAEHGAVSEECVREMAKGVMKLMGTDYSAATSGIAGPLGATPGKPVGTAWLAAARRNADGSVDVATECVHFASSRAINIERFASHALDLLRKQI
ncbi:MAG: CinA family nicotinamide mononucleotide deamidase-related protein [Bacteroidales bacterium]|nr:CinA family nicotinamide mononucleotide deamidase-related protein [Candidatus Cacconaster merdequi]